MASGFKSIEGGVTAPAGFASAGVFCDIKRLGTGKGSAKGKKRDLGLLASDRPAAVAGMFTTNQVCAAPVKVSIERARHAAAQAVVVNSGNANACTGEAGVVDAEKMTEAAGKALGIDPKHVLVCSTGRIGLPLPMPRVRRGIAAAGKAMGSGRQQAADFAEAILTSDTRPKEVAVEFELGGVRVRIGGACKGAGMIQPGMSPSGKRPASLPLHATMLCFLTTDAAVEPRLLKSLLESAVAGSFNRITVDGDMSTNDTVLLLANAAAHNPVLNRKSGADLQRFREALDFVTLELAKMIVKDGEGVSRFVTLHLLGARSAVEADAAVRAVANSALVKTSWCGGDPNWGRILDALGYSDARVDEGRVSVGYSRPGSGNVLWALNKGKPSRTPIQKLRQITAGSEFEIWIDLGLGRAEALFYAADLTEAYVDFNKGE